MKRIVPFRRAALWCAVAGAVVAAALPAAAQNADLSASPAVAPPRVTTPNADLSAVPTVAPPRCVIPQEFARFDQPLRRTARRLIAGLSIKIIAIGSSSTYGAGASSPSNTYPSRLAAELSLKFPRHEITVLNRGVNGDTTTDMLARFETGVIAERPDLVLWQVGTNSLLRGYSVQPHRTLLHDGIERLKAIGTDIALIDPQYAPRVIARPNAEEMVALLQQTVRTETVDIFHRFALMRHWRDVEGLPFSAFLLPDELHMNDFAYACVARALSAAISEAATRPIESAAVPQQRR